MRLDEFFKGVNIERGEDRGSGILVFRKIRKEDWEIIIGKIGEKWIEWIECGVLEVRRRKCVRKERLVVLSVIIRVGMERIENCFLVIWMFLVILRCL